MKLRAWLCSDRIHFELSGSNHQSFALSTQCQSRVNKLKSEDNAVVLITHYQRLLDYIVPDFVHVLYDGKIVKTGGKELALELEEKGYDWIKASLEK